VQRKPGLRIAGPPQEAVVHCSRDSFSEGEMTTEKIIKAADAKRSALIAKETALQHCFALFQARIARMPLSKQKLGDRVKDLDVQKMELAGTREDIIEKERELNIRRAEVDARHSKLHSSKNDLDDKERATEVFFFVTSLIRTEGSGSRTPRGSWKKRGAA